MNVTRRRLVTSAALGAAALPLAGCERLISQVARDLGQSIPESVAAATGRDIDAGFHLLSRAAYGPWPGDLERLHSIGETAWIDEQLDPTSIDDTACDVRARRFESVHCDPALGYEFKKPVLREELSRHTLLRAIYSRRQLFEVMVGFWSDHLNIFLEKGDCIYLKATDDREVIRRHALGRFGDLILASATSPAMLVYLDGKENRKSAPDDVPNENYARELLELHTLGVDGGYSQRDVAEVARCLTGWTLKTKWAKGTVAFDPTRHDDGEKHVLGHTIPAGGGAADLARVVEIACAHPSTANHIAAKLARRFVADDPPPSLVARVANEFTQSDGRIASAVRAILTSEEFRAARGVKVKRPFDFVVSSLRAVGADTHAHAALVEYLNRMGQGLFQLPTPDGYADEAEAWLGSLLWRWNFAVALASQQIPDVVVPLDELGRALEAVCGESVDVERLVAHFVGRSATSHELEVLEPAVNDSSATVANRAANAVALILASPAFQRH